MKTIPKFMLNSIVLLTFVLILSQTIPSSAFYPASTDATQIVVQPGLTPAYGNECSTSWKRLTDNNGWYFYVTLNTNNSNNSTNSATWRPTLPYKGRYKVEVYNPDYSQFRWPCAAPQNDFVGPGSSRPPTSQGKYTIYHSTGNNQVTVSQNPASNQWLTLGTFTFNTGTGGYVKLVDLNGETEWTRAIAFSAVRFTYLDSIISGKILDGATPISGVTVSDGNGHTAITNGSGDYVLEGLLSGTYTISPSLTGYTFSPASKSISVPPDAAGVNFSRSYSISGKVIDSGGFGINGVVIASNNGITTTTNTSGQYTLPGLTSGSYSLTPLRGGDTFTPTVASISVPASLTQNFVITSRMFISGTVFDDNGLPLANIPISCDGMEQDKVVTTGVDGIYVCNDLKLDTFLVELAPVSSEQQTYDESSPNAFRLWPIVYGWFRLDTNQKNLDFQTRLRTGKLYGVVKDSKTSAPIPNAIVTVGGAQPVKTGPNGEYAIQAPPGTYQMSVKLSGYRTFTKKVSLAFFVDNQLNVSLEPYALDVYRLPFEDGQYRYCSQGNNDTYSHGPKSKLKDAKAQYAFDFGYSLPYAVSRTVVATREGKVIAIKKDGKHSTNCNNANYVLIKHPNGLVSLYLHLSEVKVENGQKVLTGQPIGIAGNTGCSSGVHLHFQVQAYQKIYKDKKGIIHGWYAQSQPIKFLDAQKRYFYNYKDKKYYENGKSDGVPKFGYYYKSGNAYYPYLEADPSIQNLTTIISDTAAPVGSVEYQLTGQPTYQLLLSAFDYDSDTIEMRLSTDETLLSSTEWISFTDVISWTYPMVYAQFRDISLNVSEVYSSFVESVGYEPPLLAFSTNPTACTLQDIGLVNQTTPYCEQCSWNWDFGNGQVSTEIEPAFDYMWDYGFSGYAEPGEYTITLTFTNANNQYKYSKPIQVLASPNTDINISRTNLTVVVTALEENASEWIWDFGDGTIESGKQVTHIYASEDSIPPYIYLTVNGKNQCPAYSYIEIPPENYIYLPIIIR